MNKCRRPWFLDVTKLKHADAVLPMLSLLICVMETNFGVDTRCSRSAVVNEYECIFFFENYSNAEKKKTIGEFIIALHPCRASMA